MADTNNQNSFLDYAGLVLFWNNIKKIIEDNELVTATALTDLDTRLDDIEDLLAQTSPIIEKTYAELKSLKDNEQLIPGQQYKIIDYVTTVNGEYLSSGITVAGDLHLFDIVVTANTTHGFHEVARAVYNPDRDTYFRNSNLDAWKIWYCFDNDRDRFTWATEDGTGVIYRMIDEWNNDCPYDFKNIVMEDWSNTLPGGGLFYTFTVLYDNGESGREDASLYGYCHNNTIKPTCDTVNGDYNYLLNRIIFITEDTTLIHGNYLDTGCQENVFGYGCCGNKIGSNCIGNIFGKYCDHNTIGDSSESNVLGDYNSFNSIGKRCLCNKFSWSASGETPGRHFEYNVIEDGCSYNVLYSYEEGAWNNTVRNYKINRGVSGTHNNPMLIEAKYRNAENVCNVYKKGNVAVVAYIQY